MTHSFLYSDLQTRISISLERRPRLASSSAPENLASVWTKVQFLILLVLRQLERYLQIANEIHLIAVIWREPFWANPHDQNWLIFLLLFWLNRENANKETDQSRSA